MDFDSSWDVANGGEVDAFIERLLSATPDTSTLRKDEAVGQWKNWLKAYAERINTEISGGLWGAAEKAKEERKEEVRLANPRFVLRQWVLEEVIQRVERDSTSGKRVLAKVMHVSVFPFLSFSLFCV